MKLNSYMKKRCLAVLCIGLIFVYTILLFLPHTDECIDTDCVVCAMIESTKTLSAFWVSSAVWAQISLMIAEWRLFAQQSVCREGTPVGLKVKLLN